MPMPMTSILSSLDGKNQKLTTNIPSIPHALI
jgi:hypothetical protein